MFPSQVLLIQGLLWNFYGAAMLVMDSFGLFGRDCASYVPQFDNKSNIIGYDVEEKGKDRRYRPVFISKKQYRLAIWFILVSAGFLLQIISNFL